jgi:hypothetical protein
MWAPSKVLVTVLVSVLSALSLVSCTGDTEGRQTAAPSPTPTGGVPDLRVEPAPYDVEYGKVAGRIAKRERRSGLRALARPVRTWMDRGFVAGPWPRDGFDAAFAPFAGGVRSKARRDAELLTLQRQGGSLTEVIPARRRVKVSVTSVRRHVVGATARVDLRLLTIDEAGAPARVRVHGDLYLTRVEGKGWTIFGYDLERSRTSPSSGRPDRSDGTEGRRSGQQDEQGGGAAGEGRG